MTEPTQHDDAGPGNPEPKKVHTFDLIDEVPGVSDGGAGSGGGDETAPEPGPAEEPAPREPGRVARALSGARFVVGRTA